MSDITNNQTTNPATPLPIKMDVLIDYLDIGFKLVPLDDLSRIPALEWSEIYANPEFWSEEKIKDSVSKFYNVATTFGKTNIKDIDGSDLYLHCLDIDSPEVLRRVQHLLEQEWKFKTFVTKTQKDCGYHMYWFEHRGYNIQIVTDQCKKGYEFEIKCGKALCTLPGSRHRDNPLFYYECIGQSNKIMISDGLYENLMNVLLKDCLRPMKGNNRICNRKSSQTTLPVTENNAKAEQEKSRDIPSRMISLSEEKVKESMEFLVPYYQQRTRHKFSLGFSGLAFKEGVSENSAAQILQGICDKANDYEEKDDRLNTLHRTYGKGVENGHDAITGKSTLKEVIIHVSNCDEIAAESKVQELLRIWHEDCSKPKVNDDKVTPSFQAGKEDESTKGHEQNISAKELLKTELLAAGIHNPTEYAISVVSKTVKCDDSLVRGIFYAGCSSWSYDPMNLVISAPTSEGKTYTVLETLQYFPTKDVRKIGSMSPKVIVRQDSTLVDADTLEPIQYKIDDLKSQIKLEDDEKLKLRLQNELDDLNANSRLLIDLRNKIYVFLEPPSIELWNLIKPIMSHDSFVIEHPYVETGTPQGIHVKPLITLGFPTFIFGTAKDESKWEQWEEIVSRSLVMSPNMSSQKYRQANRLNAMSIGLPTSLQELLIISKREAELAKKCVQYLKYSINEAVTANGSNSSSLIKLNYDNRTWIPYTEILGNTLPDDKGTEMRTNRRLLLLIRIISLAKGDLRFQVILHNQILTIANVEDLTEALHIIQNSDGLPPYKVKFFADIIYPLYERKVEEEKSTQERSLNEVVISGNSGRTIVLEEKPGRVTLTANEICDYFNLKNPKAPINSDIIRKKYLNELVHAGYLEALDVREGNTKKVYYPIVSPSQQVDSQTQETQEYDKIPQFFSYRKINVPADYKPVPVKWLIFQILGLWKCGIDYGNGQSAIQFLDIEKDHLVITDPHECEGAGSSTITSDNTSNDTVRRTRSMRQYARKYNGSTGDLSRHFSRPIFANSHNKIFGDLQYIGIRRDINQLNSGICQNSSLS